MMPRVDLSSLAARREVPPAIPDDVKARGFHRTGQ